MAKPSRCLSNRSPSKQYGGTFLGIVLGLIAGLAIAVIVALYITRAPTPFVSKVVQSGASDVGVAAGQAQYDPNRALQGKTPGQPVLPQAAQSAPPNTAPAPSGGQAQSSSPRSGLLPEPEIIQVPPAANNGGTVASPFVASSVTAPAKKPPPESPSVAARVTPPGAVMQGAGPTAPAVSAAKPASPATPAPATANAEASTGYFLQVGAYKTEADAEKQRARLAFQGFESKVSQRDAGGVTYFRVRIGPFSKFDDMNASRQRLSDAGIDTAVIRFTKQ
jgi:cell division protein FtsN